MSLFSRARGNLRRNNAGGLWYPLLAGVLLAMGGDATQMDAQSHRHEGALFAVMADVTVRSARAGGCPVVIEGEVQAGEAFRRSMGRGLDLLLDPTPRGWIVRVLPSTGPRPPEDLAELATPPFHSINPLLLTTDFGFRAQDVVGWNPRPFRYLRRADLPAAEQAFRSIVASPHPSAEQQQAVVRIAGAAAEGRIEILDARLVPGTGDQSAAAGLVATHFLSTAHTIVAPEANNAGPLGRVEMLRFRAALATGRAPAARCR